MLATKVRCTIFFVVVQYVIRRCFLSYFPIYTGVKSTKNHSKYLLYNHNNNSRTNAPSVIWWCSTYRVYDGLQYRASKLHLILHSCTIRNRISSDIRLKELVQCIFSFNFRIRVVVVYDTTLIYWMLVVYVCVHRNNRIGTLKNNAEVRNSFVILDRSSMVSSHCWGNVC